MQRHAGLRLLSEHHHHALVQALELRRAAEASATRHPQALERAGRRFLRFWKKTGRKHFRQEEEVLLPAYARHVRLQQDRPAMRMLAQHATIRARVQQLEEALLAGHPLAGRLTALGQLLHNHVRLEENHVFPRIEAVLGEAELQALRRRLTRLQS